MKVEMTLLSNHNPLTNLQGRKGSEHSLDYLIQERTGSVFLRALKSLVRPFPDCVLIVKIPECITMDKMGGKNKD